MENNNKELKISAENALKAYNAIDAYGKELLEHLFGREVFAPQNIMERVKTFEDAVKVLGDNNASVNQYLFVANGPEMDETGKDLLAYLKLRIIAAALNEGWKPKFDGEERRWYPYFYIYTKEEYDRLDEDEKKYCSGGGRANNSANVNGGGFYAYAYIAWSCSYTHYDSRLAFRTKELAEYCGKQFIDIWMDFLIG